MNMENLWPFAPQGLQIKAQGHRSATLGAKDRHRPVYPERVASPGRCALDATPSG